MKKHIRTILTFLLTGALLTACGKSQANQEELSTQAAASNFATQTAQATVGMVGFIPSPTDTLAPTLVPSRTPTFTPNPTSTATITPTPTPPVINLENVSQVTLLDTLPGFDGAARIVCMPDGVAAMRVLEDNTLQKNLIQSHISLSDYVLRPWSFGSPVFSDDGKLFASQTLDNNGYGVTVWEVKEDLSLTPIAHNISGYSMNGWYINFSSDGKYLIGISNPEIIMKVPENWQDCAPHCEITITYKPIKNGIYKLPEGSHFSDLVISSGVAGYYDSEFSPDNVYLATSSRKTDSNRYSWIYVQLWQVSDGSLYRKLDTMPSKAEEGERANLVFSPDGAYLTIIGGGKLQNWQWEQNTFLWEVKGIFSEVDYSPDGTLLATGAPDGTIQLWQASDGTALATLISDHKSAITYVAFSPDGSLLASVDELGVLMLWSVPR